MGLGKKGFCSAATLHGSAALPFVISTEAQRSGEISVWMLFLGNVFLFRTHTLSKAQSVSINCDKAQFSCRLYSQFGRLRTPGLKSLRENSVLEGHGFSRAAIR